MKLKFLLLVVSFIIVAAIGVSWQRLTLLEAEASPGLTITPQTQDLGRVKYGDVPSTDFEVRNEGEKAVKITRISTSCGCTTVTLVGHETTLEEGQPVTIDSDGIKILRVKFNPAIHGDDTDLGSLKRTIYITTDNQDQQELQVTIEAEVYR